VRDYVIQVSFVVWLIALADPIRDDIKVELGPAVPGKTGAREVGLDKLTYYSGALSLAPVAAQLQAYFVLQVYCLLELTLSFCR